MLDYKNPKAASAVITRAAKVIEPTEKQEGPTKKMLFGRRRRGGGSNCLDHDERCAPKKRAANRDDERPGHGAVPGDAEPPATKQRSAVPGDGTKRRAEQVN